MRLNDEELQRLDSLGVVKHIIRLGAYHLGHMNGLDEQFYVDRYQAKLWLLPGMQTKTNSEASNTLTQDNLPQPNAELFV